MWWKHTCRSQITCVLGSEHRFPGLHRKHFYPPSHIAIKNILFLAVYASLCCVCILAWVPSDDKRGHWILQAGISGSCEAPEKNQAPILCILCWSNRTLSAAEPFLQYLRCFVMKYCACHYSLKLVDSSENTSLRLQPETCV